MNFKRHSGESNIKPFKKKASTAFAIGQAVALDGDGFLYPAIETTASTIIIGVIQETIASTDSDYASTRDVMVDVARKGDKGDEFIAKVGTGTGAQTHVGELVDLTSAGKLDVTASAVDVCFVTRFRSATELIVTFA